MGAERRIIREESREVMGEWEEQMMLVGPCGQAGKPALSNVIPLLKNLALPQKT